MERLPINKETDIQTLRMRLEEAENTLQAIYSGQVDSLVVNGPHGKQIFALQGTDHSYRLLVEGMQEGAVTFSSDGVIYYANKAFASLVNAPLHDIMGSSIYSLLVSENKLPIQEMMASPEKTARDRECVLTTVDGIVIPVQISLTQLLVGDTFVLCMLVTNLTERKKADEALRQSQSALSHAQKMEAIGRLAGGVAHDFNNLVTGIQGISQELLDGLELDDPRRNDIQEIMTASNRAFAVTRQLLAFSRRQVMMPKAIDVNSAAREIHKLLQRLLGEDIDIKLELANLNHSIKLDPGQFEQILMNLAINARDAMPRGGTLTIRTSEKALRAEDFQINAEKIPGPFIMIEVADTGTGMDKETLAHIFEPFFTTKEKDKGTGLGLATIYGIIQQAHGDIHVRSELKIGSVFQIYLPASPEKVERPVAEEKAAFEKSNKEIILLIEDEDIVRRVVVRRLKKLGYEILEAKSGSKAIELAKAHQNIKLVISDVIMPRMNGREAVEAIQAIHPHIKALYMSGYPADVIADHGVLQKGIAFIDKAALGADLPRRIRELLYPGV